MSHRVLIRHKDVKLTTGSRPITQVQRNYRPRNPLPSPSHPISLISTKNRQVLDTAIYLTHFVRAAEFAEINPNLIPLTLGLTLSDFFVKQTTKLISQFSPPTWITYSGNVHIIRVATSGTYRGDGDEQCRRLYRAGFYLQGNREKRKKADRNR